MTMPIMGRQLHPRTMPFRLVSHRRTPIIMPSALLRSTSFRLAFGCGYAAISLTLRHAHHILATLEYALWRTNCGYTAIPKITPTTPGPPLPQNTPSSPKPIPAVKCLFISRLSFPEYDDILRCHSIHNFWRTISAWRVRPWITITNMAFDDTSITIFPRAVSP